MHLLWNRNLLNSNYDDELGIVCKQYNTFYDCIIKKYYYKQCYKLKNT